MAESAALLVDNVLPHQPIRQWVLSFPFQLRFLFASDPESMGKVLGIVYRTIETHLERLGLLERDVENNYIQLELHDDCPMPQIHVHSITYRIAAGSQQGRKVFTLQSLPASPTSDFESVANVAGFSLHGGVCAESNQRNKLERLCRYIARPTVSENRLSLTARVRYAMN